MSSKIKYFVFFAAAYFLAMSVEARDTSEAANLLQEAMMNSNADYNKHKKAFNEDEHNRADNWSKRNVKAIAINDGRIADVAEFQDLQKEFQKATREVSSNEQQD